MIFTIPYTAGYIKPLIHVLILTVTLYSCDKDKNADRLNCDKHIIISAHEYETAPDDPLTINNLEINENCLTISFASSGCSGESWEVKLIDSGKTHYSHHPQKNLRLSLKNEELCAAVISKELTFDLTDLQDGRGRLILNIVNSGDDILYEY